MTGDECAVGSYAGGALGSAALSASSPTTPFKKGSALRSRRGIRPTALAFLFGWLRDNTRRQPNGLKTAAAVLLVEDQDAVRKILAEVLEDGGNDVIEAASGEEVLDRQPPAVGTSQKIPGHRLGTAPREARL